MFSSYRLVSRVVIGCIFCFLVPSVSFAQFGQLSREIRLQAIGAVVKLEPFDNSDGLFEPWSGTGSIISPDGYILTNYHVVSSEETGLPLEHVAVFTQEADKAYLEPTHTHWATYIAGYKDIDLALLKISERVDETPLEESFDFILLANPFDLILGDPLTVIGYPGISGDTISFTAGALSGWLGEDSIGGGQDWIKSDAKISGGNSGGAVLNNNGHLVAIPTEVYFDDSEQENQYYFRPISLAWPMLDEYVAGLNIPKNRQTVTTDDIDITLLDTNETRQMATTGTESGLEESILAGKTIENILAPDNSLNLAYHTYIYTLDKDIPVLTFINNGHGYDIDFAVHDEEISYYDKAIYSDFSRGQENIFSILNPKRGTYYIDVVNSLSYPASYDIEVIEGSLNTASSSAEALSSGFYGYLGIGESITAVLSEDEGPTSHFYDVIVPDGLKSIKVKVVGKLKNGTPADVDMIMNVNRPVGRLAEVDYRDTSRKSQAGFTIQKPEEGYLSLEVMNYQNNLIEYTLTVSYQ